MIGSPSQTRHLMYVWLRVLSEMSMYFYSLAMVYILIFHVLVEVGLAKLQN